MKRSGMLVLLAVTLLFARRGTGAEIIAQQRSLSVHAFVLDGLFEDPVIVDDNAASAAAGLFEEDLDAIANGFVSEVRGRADPTSDINAAALSFDARGNAVASMHIQGKGDVSADNAFRLTFDVGADGKVTFTLINLIVDDRFRSDVAHDRPGDAEASVRIVEDGGGSVVYEQIVVLDDFGTADEILFEEPFDVDLAPGRYALVIQALAVDDTDNEIAEVNFGLAAASYDVRGSISGGTPAPDTTPPAAPTNLTAVAGDGQVALDWDDNTESDLEEYGIYRSTTSGGPYVQVDQDDPSEFLDGSVTNGVTYYYVVTAFDLFGNESAASNEVTATPIAPPPPPPPPPPVPTTLHVDSIDLAAVGGGNKNGEATVRIVDDLGDPVAGATVTGDFSGSFDETQSATTDANGVAVLTTSRRKHNPSFTFCVTDVSHGTLAYESADNAETCDSF